MPDAIWLGLEQALGLRSDSLTATQMALRALLVYPIGIAFIRLGDKRFVGRLTAFDVIMGIMIGSILSRAITNSSPFFPTVAAAGALVALHYLFASATFHFEAFGNLVKGKSRTLVSKGEIQWDAMRKSNISEQDLLAAIRESAGVDALGRISTVRLERSGNISVIRAE